jgi:adenylosuccinate synthase
VELLPGWDEPVASIRSIDDLPAPARELLRRIEDAVGVPVTFVGTGQDRDAVIALEAVSVS